MLQRAQRGGVDAANAQETWGSAGFGGVLEAFTSSKPDEAVEHTEEIEQVEESSAGDENESGEAATDSAEKADASDGEQVVDGTDVKVYQQSGGAFSQRVHSAGDLAQLLNNAATIDLAGLASQQLGDQVSIQQSVEQSAVQQRQTVEQSPDSTVPKPVQNTDDGGNDRRFFQTAHGLNQGSAQRMQSQEVAEVGAAGRGMKSLELPAEKQSALQSAENLQPSASAKIQATQVAQSQSVDTSRVARRLDGLRSINEIASVAGKSRVVAGSEASGKAGGDQGGLDLGNKSQSTAKLMQAKPSDERAMQRREVMAQVQRGLASIMNTKGGSMKIRLSPEHLGEVNIQLATKDGHVRVMIDAERDQTRSMLKDGLEGLRNAMESRGVQVDELRIEGRQPTEFERLFGDAGGDQYSQRHDSDGQEQRQEQSGDNAIGGDRNEDTNDEPRGIWTDLGLDAIA